MFIFFLFFACLFFATKFDCTAHIYHGLKIVCALWFGSVQFASVCCCGLLVLVLFAFSSCYTIQNSLCCITDKNDQMDKSKSSINRSPDTSALFRFCMSFLHSMDKCKHTITSQFDYGQNIDLYVFVRFFFVFFVYLLHLACTTGSRGIVWFENFANLDVNFQELFWEDICFKTILMFLFIFH